jgi:Ca2+-binding EF-hand superfamily protein
VYKIKSIFEEASEPNPNYHNQEHLSFSAFKHIFPELENYPDQQIQRLYEFFDIDSKGFVDWNSFFSALTICYFGSDKDLSVILFMMFDNSLDFELDKIYLTLMIETNESYLKEKDNDEPMPYEEVVEKLQGFLPLHIDKWLKVAQKYFDFSKFRKIFNVFLEEKMEKELVKHFHSWNVIFNEER